MIKCNICRKKFDNLKSMTNHRRWHNLPRYIGFQKSFRLQAKKFNFVGDKGGYQAVHKWIRRNYKKPLTCEFCHNKTPRDLANISGVYTRNIKDYKWACKSCHKKYDINKSKSLTERRFSETERKRNANV